MSRQTLCLGAAACRCSGCHRADCSEFLAAVWVSPALPQAALAELREPRPLTKALRVRSLSQPRQIFVARPQLPPSSPTPCLLSPTVAPCSPVQEPVVATRRRRAAMAPGTTVYPSHRREAAARSETHQRFRQPVAQSAPAASTAEISAAMLRMRRGLRARAKPSGNTPPQRLLGPGLSQMAPEACRACNSKGRWGNLRHLPCGRQLLVRRGLEAYRACSHKGQ